MKKMSVCKRLATSVTFDLILLCPFYVENSSCHIFIFDGIYNRLHNNRQKFIILNGQKVRSDD